MFTGIIEGLGEIKKIEHEGSNIHFTLNCSFVNDLKVDQSLAHNGVCLTVVGIKEDKYTVTAIDETLKKTDLGEWKLGDKVNLERCMPANGRFDGHIVQGHVDTVAICEAITEKDGSWEFRFSYDSDDITVEKGSITVNGASLTVVDSKDQSFSVHIIPYTFEHTVFHQIKVGDKVNLEFDIIGKYISKILKQRNT
ncbi:MAG TPA: riboflavin synthase [Brumimicrobium sp.]|nr:riboflavin synthase [Brumimicrobium sp.]